MYLNDFLHFIAISTLHRNNELGTYVRNTHVTISSKKMKMQNMEFCIHYRHNSSLFQYTILHFLCTLTNLSSIIIALLFVYKKKIIIVLKTMMRMMSFVKKNWNSFLPRTNYLFEHMCWKKYGFIYTKDAGFKTLSTYRNPYLDINGFMFRR